MGNEDIEEWKTGEEHILKAEPPTQKDPHRSTKLNPRPFLKNTKMFKSNIELFLVLDWWGILSVSSVSRKGQNRPGCHNSP